MTAKEAKALVKDCIEKELESIHSLIEGYARLGGKAIYIDQDIAHIHPRTINILKEEGFGISYNDIDTKDAVYISWY